MGRVQREWQHLQRGVLCLLDGELVGRRHGAVGLKLDCF